MLTDGEGQLPQRTSNLHSNRKRWSSRYRTLHRVRRCFQWLHGAPRYRRSYTTALWSHFRLANRTVHFRTAASSRILPLVRSTYFALRSCCANNIPDERLLIYNKYCWCDKVISSKYHSTNSWVCTEELAGINKGSSFNGTSSIGKTILSNENFSN